MHPFLEISLVLKEQDNRSAQSKNQGAKAKSIILAVEYESVEVPDCRPINMDNNNRPELQTFAFSKIFNQASPPISDIINIPICSERPKDKPIKRPGIGSSAAPGGRKLQED